MLVSSDQENDSALANDMVLAVQAMEPLYGAWMDPVHPGQTSLVMWIEGGVLLR